MYHTRPDSGLPVAAAPAGAMFPSLLTAIAGTLALAYRVVPSYPFALGALGVLIAMATWPLTHRAFKAQAVLATLQPALRELRQQFGHDRSRLAEETTALFKRHNVSPAAGLLATIVPAPLLFGVYRVLRGLTRRAAGRAVFDPRYLKHSSRLYKALHRANAMRGFGVDLSHPGLAALTASPAAVAVVGLLVVTGVSVARIEQRLSRANGTPASDEAPALGRLASLLPLSAAAMTLALPLSITLYFAAYNLTRLAQHWVFVRFG